MKCLSKCQEIMTMQEETYQIICIIKIIINLLALIYQDKNAQSIKISSIPQQNNLTGKLEVANGATMLFIVEKQQKTFSNFSLD